MHLAQLDKLSKAKPHGLEHIKLFSQFSIKIFRVNFGNSIFDNSNWDKISEGILKKFLSGTE